jgi:hypothetical protein
VTEISGVPAYIPYMNWHANNPSPLIQRFIAMFDSNLEP